MTDDLTSRRNTRTMQGVVCALTADGTLHQDDIDEIARFRGFLLALPPRPANPSAEQRAERLRIYKDHYPEDETNA